MKFLENNKILKSTVVILILLTFLQFVIQISKVKQLEKVQEVNLNNQIEIARLQSVKVSMTDSIVYYRSEIAKIQKLIIAQELSLKNPPNENKVLHKYTSLTDADAARMFSERYGSVSRKK